MKKLVARGLLPMLAVGLLAGCAPSGSTAAIVNGVSIPDSQVMEWAQGCAAITDRPNRPGELTANELRTEMLQYAVIDVVSRQAREAAGTGPSDEQLLEVIRDEPVMKQILSNDACTEAHIALLRHNFYAMESGESYFTSFDVQLNPRYGARWNTAEVKPEGSGSMSQVTQRVR